LHGVVAAPADPGAVGGVTPEGVRVYRVDDIEVDLNELRPYDRLVIEHRGGIVQVVVGLLTHVEVDVK
jgi:hypothetical protein